MNSYLKGTFLILAATTLLAAGGGKIRPEKPPVIGPGVAEQIAMSGRVRVLVLLESPVPGPPEEVETRRAEISRRQGEVLQALGNDNFHLKHRFKAIPAFAGEINAAGIAALLRRPGVVRVDLDVGGTGSLAQSVPLTKADQVQAMGYTGEGITVAILDSGLDIHHPDLEDDLVDEACFCSGGGGCCPGGLSQQFGPGAAVDDNGHGTNVAGIVSSGGIVAPLGVAPDAGIVAIKVLDANNSFCCSSDIVAALDWIITDRPDVDVVNMSLGTSALFTGDCDLAASYTFAMANAIDTLRDNGVITFAASGNNRSGTQMPAPACVQNAVSTAAVYDANVGPVSVLGCTDISTKSDQITCFSNTNSATDLLAPGAPITSSGEGGDLSTFFGTSQASPHAAGCAADLLQAIPNLTPVLIESMMESSGPQIRDPKNNLKFPRLDCLAALENLPCNDTDSDGYGFPGASSCSAGGEEDCDDGNNKVFPGAQEQCDGIITNCNDPAWPAIPAGETDGDGDGYVDCQPWSGTDPSIAGGGDCDDGDPLNFPGNIELCDLRDNNCDGVIDEGFPDSDFDGIPDCLDPDDDNDTVPDGLDCAPLVNSISMIPSDIGSTIEVGPNPGKVAWKGAAQSNVVNVYRGSVAPGQLFSYNHTCMVAQSPDLTYQDPGSSLPGELKYYLISPTNSCGEGNLGTDSGSVFRPIPFPCPNGNSDQDNDTIPDIDDNCPALANLFQVDSDLDGVGDLCDTCPAQSNPNRADQDGDGIGDACDDNDLDGYTADVDCNDEVASIHPGAVETCNRIDDDCDGLVDERFDKDGDNFTSCELPYPDCDDANPAINPNVEEGPMDGEACMDGLDNDCDGLTDLEDPVCQGALPCPDSDGDSFADCTTDPTCDSTRLFCGDCDDSDTSINPALTGFICTP